MVSEHAAGGVSYQQLAKYNASHQDASLGMRGVTWC
jgi:hypothetical protein